jgi:hypothetical protein
MVLRRFPFCPHLHTQSFGMRVPLQYNPNPEREIHDCASSSHPRALRKIIVEPLGATQI